MAKTTEYPVEILDTTLRDGSQTEGVSFSLEDKLRIAARLDEFGIHFIEGGFPKSNPKDREFFKKVRELGLKNSKICSFGSTRRKGYSCSKDDGIQCLIKAEPDAITIVGKSWDLHAEHVLKVSKEMNVAMIADTIGYLKKKGIFVIFDAEHFFDGYLENKKYAMETIIAASEQGADRIVLCDTNGGSLTDLVHDVTAEVVSIIGGGVGIHAHNDSELAVANTLAAVSAGATHVQGTINGLGERCGNSNLCSVIPNLMLKMKNPPFPDDNLAGLTDLANFISELANQPLNSRLPYVGKSAFTHKAGLHIDGVRKVRRANEHIIPEKVGNHTRTLISEVAGRANVLHLTARMGIDLSKKPGIVSEILEELKVLEYSGHQFEAAEGSFEILVRKKLGEYKSHFELGGFKVTVDKRRKGEMFSEATIKVKVGGQWEFTVGEGDGPVNALDNALRKALISFYPSLKEMRLTDYKVRVLDERDGTAAAVRVLIASKDNTSVWGTVGVSENVIQASWKALVESIEFKLMKDGTQPG
ncbi:MAG TPA: citramalate synthase [bacterium]|nr:citramalate synthase [bacterium]